MKNTTKTLAIAIVLLAGTFANAEGIIITSRSEGIIITSRAETGCTEKESTGILVSDRASGILKGIVEAIGGILVSDRGAKSCEEKGGILVSDRGGILVSD